MLRIAISLAVLLALGVPALAADREPAAAVSSENREQEQYEQSMKERLGRLGEKLDHLKKAARQRSAEAEQRLTEKMAEVERQQKLAERKLKELGEASRETWQRFSTEAEKAARDFERSVERIMTEE